MNADTIELIDPSSLLPDLQEAVDRVLEMAKKHGASDAVAAVSVDRGMSVTARMGEVETVEMQADKGVSVTVYRAAKNGTHKGSASTSDLSIASLEKTVAAAIQLADFTEADEYAGLADKALMATDFPDLDLYHPWSISTDEAIRAAIACEAAALNFDKRITNSDGASVNTGAELTVLGNSQGFSAEVLGTGHSISCAVLAEEAGAMQRDYAWTSARDARDLDHATSIGEDAAERSVAKLLARGVKTGCYPVLFDRRVARGLFGSLFGALSGGAQYRGNSFLQNSIGQLVLPEWLSISEHPHLLKGSRSTPFDQDAVATREQTLVADGVVQQYLLGVYSAANWD